MCKNINTCVVCRLVCACTCMCASCVFGYGRAHQVRSEKWWLSQQCRRARTSHLPNEINRIVELQLWFSDSRNCSAPPGTERQKAVKTALLELILLLLSLLMKQADWTASCVCVCVRVCVCVCVWLQFCWGVESSQDLIWSLQSPTPLIWLILSTYTVGGYIILDYIHRYSYYIVSQCTLHIIWTTSMHYAPLFYLAQILRVEADREAVWMKW